MNYRMYLDDSSSISIKKFWDLVKDGQVIDEIKNMSNSMISCSIEESNASKELPENYEKITNGIFNILFIQIAFI